MDIRGLKGCRCRLGFDFGLTTARYTGCCRNMMNNSSDGKRLCEKCGEVCVRECLWKSLAEFSERTTGNTRGSLNYS